MTDFKPPALFLQDQYTEVPIDRFEGDLYERKKLADKLTGLLTRLPDGGVISIDSPWGEGKTWFGKRWCAALTDAGFKTAYIDCFQRDHIDDPFTMIAGEFIALAKADANGLQEKMLDAGKRLGAAILPAAAKFAVNTIGHWATGQVNMAEDVTKAVEAIDASAALEKLVASRLKGYEESKKSIAAFKETLATLSGDPEKPVVIFLDELDRCRPDFAVKTVERMKHFFDSPGVVFVLLLNKQQLAAAVQGIYGAQVDAEAYLSKFIPISLALPKLVSVEHHWENDNQKHCKAELLRVGFQRTQEVDNFSTMLGILATLFEFSLRDVERAVTMYSFAQPPKSSAAAVTWPIALKLKRPDLYRRLRLNDASAHAKAKDLALAMRNRAPDASWTFSLFEALHESGANKFNTSLPDEINTQLYSLGNWNRPKDYFTWIFGCIDLNVTG